MHKRVGPVLACFALAVSWPVLSETPTAVVVPEKPNYVKDSRFESLETTPAEAGRRAKPIWVSSQHAGEISYRFTSDEGVMSMERYGAEVGGQLFQTPNVMALRGKELEFSAELRATFAPGQEDDEAHNGLGVNIRGVKPGFTPVLGTVLLLMEYAEPGLTQSSEEWVEQTIRFTVPDNATALEISINLGWMGTLEVRNPALVEVEPEPS